eukprot:TRINITY_DN8687_c0_g1_i1.p1 TRINITY_DN8687_c0_g1~~TRINITY_DN8687_c0_g1_i1.p1  ORF type:complete len:104 (+),score=18.48 TRINITY_DN8687_c0_g1_i1:197-508(+)
MVKRPLVQACVFSVLQMGKLFGNHPGVDWLTPQQKRVQYFKLARASLITTAIFVAAWKYFVYRSEETTSKKMIKNPEQVRAIEQTNQPFIKMIQSITKKPNSP